MHQISDLDLTKWVGDFIKKHDLSGEKGKIVVGLSGGPDSILLSHVCEALKEQGELYSVRHIHIDHGLRKRSGEEALTLKKWAKDWRWEFSLKKLRDLFLNRILNRGPEKIGGLFSLMI